ncbi:hypothetical protein N657DRAFT_167126 [Parathielavia appendiculata]|uniref:Uncharacterized protein n=1 Tax=Parathielavia appendiculata TaxID=2587402 RepID=A0AAN6Z042_9PEZI|nr:hypothetical protein N657DRAFT_167126 [Parathielavia appendiculata]
MSPSSATTRRHCLASWRPNGGVRRRLTVMGARYSDPYTVPGPHVYRQQIRSAARLCLGKTAVCEGIVSLPKPLGTDRKGRVWLPTLAGFSICPKHFHGAILLMRVGADPMKLALAMCQLMEGKSSRSSGSAQTEQAFVDSGVGVPACVVRKLEVLASVQMRCGRAGNPPLLESRSLIFQYHMRLLSVVP